VRLLHDLAKIHATFDDPHLVSRAGLVPVMALGQRAGLHSLVRRHVRISRPCGVNAQVKVPCLVAGMIAGADSLDGMGLLRHGALPAVFGGIRAPSTPGSFLRAFAWGNVLQLQKAHRQLLTELARRAPLLPGADVLAFIDIDSQQKRVYGHAKQGAAFGFTKIQGKGLLVRGLNVLAASVCTPLAAPVIAATRLRGGNAASARGAASMVAEAAGTCRAAGCTGTLIVRMDSAFCGSPAVSAARRAGAHFSVTVRMDPKVAAAIAGIPGDAWRPIRYPRAIWDDQLGRWVSDAEVAEMEYTAFTSRTGQEAITARLIVRRVRDLNRKAAAGQGELFTAWRYHAVFTDSPFTLPQAEEHHRGHAQGRAGLRRLDRRPARAPALRLVPCQRRLAGARSDQLQPAARRRMPGQPRQRQSPRCHPAPRPHRCCRAHCPPRPRTPHHAPARRPAPAAGMGQPVSRRNRPARSCGLTSPDRSPRPSGPTAPDRPPVPAQNPDKPQNSERQENHTRHRPQDQPPGPAAAK
jgi:Transposase DDE domain group 1